MQKTETNTKTKTFKRLFACIMVIVMALTAVPLGALDGFDLGVKASAASVVKSGNCGAEGNNVKWKLYSDGKLVISGKGDMKDFNWYYGEYPNAPYATYADDYENDMIIETTIKSVVIEEGVTSIGDYAFFPCTSLVSVTIPNGVTRIGNCAFGDCRKLKSITLPDSVTSIETDAFNRCRSLVSIKIPDNVEYIYDQAFYSCRSLKNVTLGNSVKHIGDNAFSETGLTSITIPDSVMYIGSYSFCDCTSLTNITVSENNANYSSKDGVLFNKDQTTLICYPAGKENSAYNIPESVIVIDDLAFHSCKYLKSISIPQSVTYIDMYTFADSKSLESIVIPNSVTKIGQEAFIGCSNLKSISIPDSVIHVGDDAFKDTAWYNNQADGIVYAGKIAYRYKGEMPENTQIILKDGTKAIAAGAFAHTSNLVSIAIPNTVTDVNPGAFYRCFNLKDVYYTGSQEQWKATSIDVYNDALINANIHYNYKPCNHTFKTTTTPATASKDGKIVTACTICKMVTKTVVIPKASSITLSATSYTYNGKVKTPTVTVKDSKGKTLKKGTDYTVTYASGRKNIGKYAVKVTFKGNYSGTKTLYFNIVPPATGKLSVSQSSSTLKASWKAVSGVTGYKVYLYKGSKLLKSVKTKKTSYTFKSLASGTTYKVVVKAYKTVGKSDYASSSKSLTVATKPGTPTLKVAAGSKKAVLSWNKQTGASGYLVYMSTSKNGTYKKVVTVKGGSSVKYTKTGLTKGKTYYFKVRAYKTVDGKNIYGSFSSVKAVKVK